MKRILFLLLFTPCCAFATQYYIEGNIHAGRHRFFKLDDGSYWEAKLEHGYFSCDHESGSDWWRFDPVDVEQGDNVCYPYLFTNARNGQTLFCKQVDPALPQSCGSAMAISIHYNCPQVKMAYSPYLLDSNVYAKGHRFFKLDDGSYWEAHLDNGYFSKDLKTGSFWRRGDQIKIGCSDSAEFPYVLTNERSGESLFCRQVDPAFPDSTYTVLYIEKECDEGRTTGTDYDDKRAN